MVTIVENGSAIAPAAGRRQRRREETCERIFLASMELFSSKGFAHTTVEEITRAADVGKGTFFNYFPSKEHVLGYLVAKQKGAVQFHRELAQGRTMSSEEVLTSLGRSLLRFPSKSPQMALSLVAAFLGNAEVRENIVAELAVGRRWIAEIIRLGQERGELSDALPTAALARVFQRTLFGSVLFWALDPAFPIGREFGNTMRIFFSGLKASPKPPGKARSKAQPKAQPKAPPREREAR